MTEESKGRPPAVAGPGLDNLTLPAPPLGIPAFAEIRNWSERKRYESFSKLLAAKNELLGLMVEQKQLLIDLQRTRYLAVVQMEKLDDLREIETLKIEGQLEELRWAAKLRKIQLELEAEELEIRLADARRRRAAQERQPSSAPPQSEAERLEAELSRVSEIDAVLKARRQRILDAAGDAPLTEDQQDDLDRIETFRRVRLQELFGELN